MMTIAKYHVGRGRAFAGMSEGRYSLTTRPPALTLRVSYAVRERLNVGFMDAPVSGGQQGAENGALTVMVGGSQRISTALHRS